VLREGALGICLSAIVGAVLLPLPTPAQRVDKIIRLGIICGTQCVGAAYVALDDELRRLGWVEGRNITIDRRGAGGEQERLPTLAAELVALKPDLVVAVGVQPTRAAKDAAGTIPIVMVAVADS